MRKVGSLIAGVVDSTMIDDNHGYHGTIKLYPFIDFPLLIDINRSKYNVTRHLFSLVGEASNFNYISSLSTNSIKSALLVSSGTWNIVSPIGKSTHNKCNEKKGCVILIVTWE